MVHLGRSGRRRSNLSCRSNLIACRGGRAGDLRRLVLSQNETASHHHMQGKILSVLLLWIFSPLGQALACPFGYGAEDGRSTEHMAVALGCGSPWRKEPHLDASGILGCLDRGGTPAWICDSTLGKARESVSTRQGSARRPRRRPAV